MRQTRGKKGGERGWKNCLERVGGLHRKEKRGRRLASMEGRKNGASPYGKDLSRGEYSPQNELGVVFLPLQILAMLLVRRRGKRKEETGTGQFFYREIKNQKEGTKRGPCPRSQGFLTRRGEREGSPI